MLFTQVQQFLHLLPLLLLTLISSDALSADYSQEAEINYGVVSFVLP